MAKAIQNEEVVEFEYKKLDAKAYEKRTVEPWHLACVSGQWYLLGYDQTREARRIFVLARMRNVCSAKRLFSSPRPGDGDIQKLFQNSFQIWQTEDAKLLQIDLCFSGRAAQLVRERDWHPSQPGHIAKKGQFPGDDPNGAKRERQGTGARLNQRTNFGEDWASAE